MDEVVIAPDEFERYLWLAYKDAEFKKPRNIFGFTRRIPARDQEALMLENIEITDDDLKGLADLRANAAKDYLLATGRVEADTVKTLSASTLAPEKKEGARDNRVEFSLK